MKEHDEAKAIIKAQIDSHMEDIKRLLIYKDNKMKEVKHTEVTINELNDRISLLNHSLETLHIIEPTSVG